jgi:ketosteroid isomerase-like protein
MGTADKNAEVVRRGYEAFNNADMAVLTATFDESATWHTPGRGLLAGDTPDRDATFAHFGRYGSETGGTFKASLQDVLTSSDGRVIGMNHNSAERNGQHLDVECCIVFEVTNGKVTSGTEYFYDLHAWDEFWS